MFDRIAEGVNARPSLIARGDFVSTRFLLEAGSTAWLVTVDEGRITKVQKGPFVMPTWTFALRAAEADWAAFMAPLPAPGFHDLFALLKHKRLKIEGDLHVFMANLRYFKEIFAALKELEA